MFDVVTYALVKKMVGQAAAGISDIKFSNGELIFYLPDNSTIKVPVPFEAGVVDAKVDDQNNLTIFFDDSTSLTYAAPSREEFNELVEKVDSLEINQLNLASQQNSLLESQKILEQSLDDLGLSVVDGLLNITWNDEEANYQ